MSLNIFTITRPDFKSSSQPDAPYIAVGFHALLDVSPRLFQIRLDIVPRTSCIHAVILCIFMGLIGG